MLRIPLIPDATELVLAPRAAGLGPVWQIGVLALLLIVPTALVIWLYRYELAILRRWHARGLLVVRLLMLVLLWIVVALQPVISQSGAEGIKGRVCVAVDLSASMDIIDAHRSAEEADALARAFGAPPTAVAQWSRREIAKRVLVSTKLDLLRRLAARHRIEVVGFHEARRPADIDNVDALFSPAPGTAGRATDLRQGLLDPSGTGALDGIVILTDGRHTRGAEPIDLARQLGTLGVPIYAIAIGSEMPPPDLVIAELMAPHTIVKDATLPVTVRVKATRLPPQELKIELTVDSQHATPEQRRHITHQGPDATYDLRFEVPMKEAGSHKIAVQAQSTRGKEATLANNQRTHVVHVAQERTRVLLVDEEARWEYHYLAAALARDPSVRLDRVLFAPPRLGLVKPAEVDAAGLPRTRLPEAPADGRGADPLGDYACVILGDVGPDRLPAAERKRLQQFVAERGGTLVVVAGKRAMPLAYMTGADRGADPLVQMLPIREPRVFEKRDGFLLRLTEAGKRAPMLRLDEDGTANWPDLPKHFWSIVGTRQPGAAVLAAPAANAQGEHAGLLVQQPYGFGKVLFVGIDSTWRWRQRTGDAYHHRFWGQVVRWAAADHQLPAGNHLVRFGSRAPVYRAGQPIELAMRLSEQAPPLAHPEDARLNVLRLLPDGVTDLAAVVPLHAITAQNRTFEATLSQLPPGSYTVELGIAELGHMPPAPFTVLPEENRELLDLSPNWELLQALAQQSHGRHLTPADAAQVVELLAQKVQSWQERQDMRAWQDAPLVWWTLGVLVGLLAVEWVWRKRLDLP